MSTPASSPPPASPFPVPSASLSPSLTRAVSPPLSPRPALAPLAGVLASSSDATASVQLADQLELGAAALAVALVFFLVVHALVGLWQRCRPERYRALEAIGGQSSVSMAYFGASKRRTTITLFGLALISAALAACAMINPSNSRAPYYLIEGASYASLLVVFLFLRFVLARLLRLIDKLVSCCLFPDGYEVTMVYEYLPNTDISALAQTLKACCCGQKIIPTVQVFGDTGAMGAPRRLWVVGTWWGGRVIGRNELDLQQVPERTGLKGSSVIALYDEHPELRVASNIYELTFRIPADRLGSSQDLKWIDLQVPENSKSVFYVHWLKVRSLSASVRPSGGSEWIFPAYYKLGVNQFWTRVFEGMASLPHKDSERVRLARREALDVTSKEWRWQLYTRETGFTNEAWGAQQDAALPSACWFGRTSTNGVPLLGFSGKQQEFVPVNEYFGAQKTLDFYKAGVTSAIASFEAHLASKEALHETWRSSEEVTNTWLFTPLKAPLLWTSRRSVEAWQDDREFAAQLVQGVYPDSMVLMRSVPIALAPHLGASVGALCATQRLPSGLSVGELLRQKSLFLSDVSFVAEYQPLAQGPAVGAMIVTVKLPASKLLSFVGIKLNWTDETGASRTQWYSPEEDTPADWLLAKTYARFALSNQHEAVVHALDCHLRSEPYAVAARRCLSVRHPIYKLLYPHLRSTILINFLARQALISPGGVFDTVSTLAGSKQGFLKMMADQYAQYGPLHQHVPRKLRAAGLMPEQCALKEGDYPYRDFALPIWDQINALVSQTVLAFYTSERDVLDDNELQAWLSELQTDGFPLGHFRSSNFQSRAELIELLTTVIWVASGRHAAVNFLQYSQMAFGPNAPLWAHKLPPAKGVVSTSDDVLAYSTTRSASVGQAATVWILSQYGSDKLNLLPPPGERYQELWTSGPGLDAVKAFTDKMALVQVDGERNAEGTTHGSSLKYEVLLPAQVPGSVAI